MSDSFETPACQAPLSMGLPRQEYWSELLFPSPGGLPNPGIEPSSPALAGRSFTTEPPGNLDVTSQCCELSSFPFTCFLLCYSCSCTIFCSSHGAPQGQNPQLTYDGGLPCHPCTGPWLLISDSWGNEGMSESRWNQQRQFLILPSVPTHLYDIFLMPRVLTGNPQNIKEIIHDVQKLCSFEVKWFAKHRKMTNHDPQPSSTPSVWVEGEASECPSLPDEAAVPGGQGSSCPPALEHLAPSSLKIREEIQPFLSQSCWKGPIIKSINTRSTLPVLA